jgi:predicted 3-demethylubiquinone-9 3-methyltransferase (glyoxalase superfamily)
MTKISPHLWYTDKADEAAAFYATPCAHPSRDR